VSLVDEFGTRTVTVREPKRICNPADKNDEDPSAPNDPGHLVAYNLSDFNPPFQRVRHQVIANQFGSITVDLARPTITFTPGGIVDVPGNFISLQINTSATNPAVQWRKDGVAISSASPSQSTDSGTRYGAPSAEALATQTSLSWVSRCSVSRRR